jgi:glutaredoxin
MITVYSKNVCSFCTQAKQLLTTQKIPFVDVNIDDDLKAREFVLGQGHRSVPVFYEDNQLFAEGYIALHKKLKENHVNSEE